MFQGTVIQSAAAGVSQRMTATPLDVASLRASFGLVIDREPELTARFYATLFTRYPQARSLFGRHDPRSQQQMLQSALGAVIDHLEDAAWLTETLGALGRRHEGYGVTPAMYDWVGESLLATLAEIAADAWTPALAAAWTDAYGAIARMMQARA
jgi:hemoglobin-like flavoprotein